MNNPSAGSSTLLINESPMQFLPSLACLVGEDGALFLQQVHYWLQHTSNFINGHFWVYNTMDSWRLQFCWWSDKKIRRLISNLRDFKYEGETYHLLVTEQLNLDKMSKLLYYRIDYDELNKMVPLAQEYRARKMWSIINASKQLSLHKEQLMLHHRELMFMPDGQLKTVPSTQFEDESRGGQNDRMGENTENQGSGRSGQNDRMENLAPEAVKMTVSKRSERPNASGQSDRMQAVKTSKPTIITTDDSQQMTTGDDRQQSTVPASLPANMSCGVVDDLSVKRLSDFLKQSGIVYGLNAPNILRSMLATYPQWIIKEIVMQATAQGVRSLPIITNMLKEKMGEKCESSETAATEGGNTDAQLTGTAPRTVKRTTQKPPNLRNYHPNSKAEWHAAWAKLGY